MLFRRIKKFGSCFFGLEFNAKLKLYTVYQQEGDNMEINNLIASAFFNANEKGFWSDLECNLEDANTQDEINAIGNRLMMICGEVGEAQEGLRHGDKDNFKEELADVMIRLADLCGGLEIDLEYEIKKKMEINSKRPYLHGKKF